MTSLTHKQKEGKSHGNGIYNHFSYHKCRQFCRRLLLLFGAVTLGTNLKDHNGPGISSGAWSIAGGVLIIAVATYFGTLTVS